MSTILKHFLTIIKLNKKFFINIGIQSHITRNAAKDTSRSTETYNIPDLQSTKERLTYIKDGAIEGLPYDKIIEQVRENSSVDDISEISIKIIDNLEQELIAYEIDHKKLKEIKRLFKISDSADSPYVSRSSELMSSMVIHYKNTSGNGSLQGMTADLSTINNVRSRSRYYRLGFARNDNNTVLGKTGLIPLKLRREEIFAYISVMNPQLNNEKKIKILDDLYKYKKRVQDY